MQLAEALSATQEVRGWLTSSEQSLLYRLAGSAPAGGTIVELGSWMGRSTIMLGAGSLNGPRATVHAVDHFATVGETGDRYANHLGRDDNDYFGDFDRNVRAAGVESVVEPHRGDTVGQAKAWAGPPIDLLFIDADHSYEGVRADFLAWLPRCCPGATVAFHDYVNPSAPGVRQFVDQVLEAGGMADVAVAGSIAYGKLAAVDPATLAGRIGRPSPWPGRARSVRGGLALDRGWTALALGDRDAARALARKAVGLVPWRYSAWALLVHAARKPARTPA